jgi:hypothetical protein
MKLYSYNLLLISLSLILTYSCSAQKKTNNDLTVAHPRLVLTEQGVKEMRAQLGKVPLFDQTVSQVKAEVDAEIELGIHVPIPKDMAGGYTHEQHKRNYLTLQKAGVLYQILNQEKYAKYVKELLLAYAKLYPTLSIHPQESSYARGKLFWQSLNDSNWLVYVSQAYDCVYNYLSPSERKIMEQDLFRPYADYISIESPQFFNRVHNHSTWGNVAVGMIGLAMNDEELVERALNGLKDDNTLLGLKDNDGGYIKVEGQKVGYIANLEEPFSPDGYYTEGPYYQRYAMLPFMIFATALQNTKPELKIFEYKNGVLLKAVEALLNLSNSKGEFYPLNDAQKGMSYYSRELVSSVNIAYYFGGNNPSLLSIAKSQGIVQLDHMGLAVAMAIIDGKEKPFDKNSIEFTDGADGKQGGIGIIRSKQAKDEFSLVMKYSSQGLSHGHYDKLSYSFYYNDKDVIQDYGLARFVNIEQKNGGGYLKENTTWAKQTIAHNTLVQNETSHFKGDYDTGSKHHSDKYLFDVENSSLQIVSAKETNAYPGSVMHRTMAVIKDKKSDAPFVLDILKVTSNTSNQYDLPFYYLGQLLSTNFSYESLKSLNPLGNSNGYQHLWVEGKGKSKDINAQITWLSENIFYTLTTNTTMDDELIFGRIGANDPQFNLRRDPVFIVRKKNSKDAVFASVIEPHGSYTAVSEIAKKAFSVVKNVNVIYNDNNYTAVQIENKDNSETIFILCNLDNLKNSRHQLKINEKVYQWTGPYYINQ